MGHFYKMYCTTCKTRCTEYHVHCDYCGIEIYEGDECCKAGDKYFCTDCYYTTELEAPEPDYDFERKARLEREIEDA